MASVPHSSPSQDRSSGISRRAMLTASAAAGLSGLCAGYAMISRPLLQPAKGVEQRPFEFQAAELATSRVNKLAVKYLPDAPWAATAEYEVQNGRSILYFNRYKTFDPKPGEPTNTGSEVLLEPFAMVLPPKADRPHEAPVTVIATRAYVRLEGTIAFDAGSDPGRIISGRMPGAVRLRGPEGLDLQGSDFRFDEAAQRVWSDNAVAFKHGPHQGTGHGLQLELFRVAAPQSYEAVAVNGINIVRLLRDVKMDLVIDDSQGGPFGSLDGQPAETTATEGATPLPTTVTCAGAFTFDVDRNRATFTKNVVASRTVPDAAPDRLECELLTLGFAPSTPEARQSAADRRAKIRSGRLTEDDGFQTVDEDLAVKWLVASQPAGSQQPARLHSPVNEFVADFSQLRYDAATGVTTLTRRDGAVEARQNSSRLVSPVVTIEPSPGDAPPAVVCIGKGWLQHVDEQGVPALTAHWNESLRRMRAADGLDLIRLIGEARVEQPQDKFALGGDRIDLWLDPEDDQAEQPSARPRAALADTSGMKPLRLIAESLSSEADPRKNLRVKLRSPELLADATRLEVEFVDPAPPATATAYRGDRTRLRPASKHIALASAETDAGPPAAPAPEFAPPQQPVDRSAPAEPADELPTASQAVADTAPQSEKPPAEPIELAAAVIRVIAERPQQTAESNPATGTAAAERDVEDTAGAVSDSAAAGSSRSLSGRDGQVREVHTTGGVIVRQKRATGEPLLIEGDRLDLFNRGVEQELVHIFGTPEVRTPDGRLVRKAAPARVFDQGSTLFGLNINLDRATNRAWVEGQGVLELPAKGAANAMRFDGDEEANVEADQATDVDATEEAAPAAESSEPAKPELLTVWWHDSMEFDGRVATFHGDVQTELQSNLMTCQEMIVTLTDRFDFAAAGRPDTGSDAQQPEIAEVLCRHRVRVDGQIQEAGKLVEVRRAEFDEFRLDQRTGDTRATGPGWIEIWQRGDGNRAALAPDNTVRANSSTSRERSGWEYMFVEFSRTSDGNINRQTTTFRNDVRVVYGPVSDHTRKIDPHRPDKAPAEAGWLTCKELTLTRHKKVGSRGAYSDVLGEGNVRIAGRGFSGVADWVSYDESKGQYVLKSFGNHSAIVSRSNVDGRGAGGGEGQQITFYPATGSIKVDKASGLDGVQ